MDGKISTALFSRLKAKIRLPLIFIFLIFGVVVVWMLWGATSHFWAVWGGAIGPSDEGVPAGTTAAGAWGDSFGGFNALVGAIGASAVAATLYLQYLSIEDQKRDQHLSRFEENFFKLLDLMRSLRGELVYEQTDAFLKTQSEYVFVGKVFGHDAIEAAYYEAKHWVFKLHHGKPSIREKIIAGVYDNYIHGRFEFCFSPYFRIIYTSLYKIKNDKILSDEQKAYYANIIRSHMTSFEIGLLAFNGTSRHSKDLSELIVHFRLLKYLPEKRKKVLGKIYAPEAYAPRT